MSQRSDHDRLPNSFSRRGLLGLAAGAAALVATNSIAGAQDGSPASGEWTFTDDKGVTITLPERPLRIVADVNAAAPLWDFGIRPVAVFGWNANETGDFGVAGGRINASQVEVVGDEVETIRLEDTLAMNPDLVLTLTWEPDNPDEYWSMDPSVVGQVKNIAPILAISATGRADVNLGRFAELAEALGADLSTPEQQEQKTRFDAALTDFQGVAAEKRDLTNLFAFVTYEPSIYIANPADWADLAWYRDLGLNIIDPDAEPLEYWELLGPEGALKYPSDILWESTRSGTLSPEELQADAVYDAHPAIKAGQIGMWNQDFILSYQGMADALENLSAVVDSAQKVIS